MTGIHGWWRAMAGERYWLGVPGQDDGRPVLATARSARYDRPGAAEPLIGHVRDGDVVFLYDEGRRAIAGCALAMGRARRRNLCWSDSARSSCACGAESHREPGWAIRLTRVTALEAVVSIGQIAHVQWDLFPALRALEDTVGEPLYYAFAMGSRTDSSLMSGGVFKLPALFVRSFDSLAGAARRVERTDGADARRAVPASRAPWSAPEGDVDLMGADR